MQQLPEPPAPSSAAKRPKAKASEFPSSRSSNAYGMAMFLGLFAGPKGLVAAPLALYVINQTCSSWSDQARWILWFVIGVFISPFLLAF